MTAPGIVFVGGHLMIQAPVRRGRTATAGLEPAATRMAAMGTRDWAKDIRKVWEVVMYVARYGKQPVDHVEHWDMSKLLRVAKGVSSLLEAEAKAAKGP